MKTFFTLVLTFVLFVVGGMMGGLHFGVFLHTPHLLLMIYGPLTVGLLYSEGLSGALSLMRRLFSRQANDRDADAIRNLVSQSLFLGAAGTVLHFIILMGHLSEGTDLIGFNVAAAMVSMFYGALPAILLLPLAKTTAAEKSSMLKIAASFAGFVLISNLGIFTMTMWILK